GGAGSAPGHHRRLRPPARRPAGVRPRASTRRSAGGAPAPGARDPARAGRAAPLARRALRGGPLQPARPHRGAQGGRTRRVPGGARRPRRGGADVKPGPYVRAGGLVVLAAGVVAVAAPQYRSTVARVALFALAVTGTLALVDLMR